MYPYLNSADDTFSRVNQIELYLACTLRLHRSRYVMIPFPDLKTTK